jgi:hypothetical protein
MFAEVRRGALDEVGDPLLGAVVGVELVRLLVPSPAVAVMS